MWHLKDRELEKKLIAIDCVFLYNLNDAVNEKIEEFSPGWMEEGDLITLMFCRDHQIELGELYFLFSELEEVPEYNPHAWNEYPKVKPPQHEPLRVEFADKSGTKAFFDDCLREYVTAKRIDSPCRYRPWED